MINKSSKRFNRKYITNKENNKVSNLILIKKHSNNTDKDHELYNEHISKEEINY